MRNAHASKNHMAVAVAVAAVVSLHRTTTTTFQLKTKAAITSSTCKNLSSPFSRTRIPLLSNLRPVLSTSSRLPALKISVFAAAAMATTTNAVRSSVELTSQELKLFDTLKDVLRHFGLQTQLRVAGGWVRDKLLGKNSSDIDIALDNMLGREFCDNVNEYLALHGEESRRIAVIQSNPEQSKHLETATMKIFDMQIDFVNLRSEKYVENSRIPSMEFGTPEQDAYRRDLTINSLFYNINSGSVEDLTGRGILHLKAGIIATPLPPKTTFLDDPLRVLRAIRFGARFNFSLDEDLKKAAAEEEVRVAMEQKISRERIGHEIDLMITGSQPDKSMRQLQELQLFSCVFSLPANLKYNLPNNFERLCVKHLEEFLEVLNKVGLSIVTIDQRRLSLYSALLLPLRNSIYEDRKGKMFPVSSSVMKESLKLKLTDSNKVTELHKAAEEFNSFIQTLNFDKCTKVCFNNPEDSDNRVNAGLLLRKIKELWRAALLLSTLLRYPISENLETFGEELTEKRTSLYKSVEAYIKLLELENIWNVKPLLDGKEIMSVLGLKSGGPQIKEWQQELLTWQLARPNGTSNECMDWLRETNSKRLKTH